MRGRELILVKNFAIGGALAVKALPIPRRNAGFIEKL